MQIRSGESLAPLTTFKIGGPARYFDEVFEEKDLKEKIGWAKKKELELFLLGGGSNILVADEGFDGMVIKLENKDFEIAGTKMKVGAGMELREVVRLARQNSLSGLEFCAGIPGKIGGAVRGNAGAFGKAIGSVVQKVKVLDSKTLKTFWISQRQCSFSYRHSVFKEKPDWVITEVILQLRHGVRSKIEAKEKEYLRKRSHLPKEPSAGCIFKNIKYQKVKGVIRISGREKRELEEVLRKTRGMIPVGFLIEKAGLKGTRIGNCQISPQHGNIIVNLGGGKAKEVLQLISLMKEEVKKRYNLELEEEITYVGFG